MHKYAYIQTYVHIGNSRQVILNIHDNITTSNTEETLIAQIPGLNLANGNINANLIYVAKTL